MANDLYKAYEEARKEDESYLNTDLTGFDQELLDQLEDQREAETMTSSCRSCAHIRTMRTTEERTAFDDSIPSFPPTKHEVDLLFLRNRNN